MSRLRPLITRLICQFPLLSDNHILMSTGERLDHPPNLSISIIGLMGDRKGRPGSTHDMSGRKTANGGFSMNNRPAPESIPISSLNALEYCSRRFYYQFVHGDTLVNEFVLEGNLLHKRVHQAGTQTTTTAEGEIVQTTRPLLTATSSTLHPGGEYR